MEICRHTFAYKFKRLIQSEREMEKHKLLEKRFAFETSSISLFTTNDSIYLQGTDFTIISTHNVLDLNGTTAQNLQTQSNQYP